MPTKQTSAPNAPATPAAGSLRQIGMLLAIWWRRFAMPGSLQALLTLAARGFVVLSFVGSLQIAGYVLLDLGPIDSPYLTWIPYFDTLQQNKAYSGALVILVLFGLSGAFGYLRLAHKAHFSRLISREMHGLLLTRKARIIRSSAGHDLNMFTSRANIYGTVLINLSEILAYISLLALATAFLVAFMLEAFLVILVILIPIFVLYIFAGRRLGAQETKLRRAKSTQKKQFLRVVNIAKRRKDNVRAESPSELYFDTLGAGYEHEREIQRSRLVPDLLTTVGTGAVLATMLLYLSGLTVAKEQLVFLMLGFIVIRFGMGYVQALFSSFRNIFRNMAVIGEMHSIINDAPSALEE